jgi:hypothetical protein
MVATHAEVSQSLNKPRIESSYNSSAEGLEERAGKTRKYQQYLAAPLRFSYPADYAHGMRVRSR